MEDRSEEIRAREERVSELLRQAHALAGPADPKARYREHRSARGDPPLRQPQVRIISP